MTRSSRQRSRDFAASFGSVEQWFSTILLSETPVSGYTRRDLCYDTIGPIDEDGDLYISHYTNAGIPSFSGTYSQGSYKDVYKKVTPWAWANQSGIPSIPLPNWDILAAKALAAANPNKPRVDLPLFIFELREFPFMLKQLGQVLRGKISSKSFPEGYLAYQFGWAPLLSDLKKLLDFSDMIAERARRLQKLSTSHGSVSSGKLGSTRYRVVTSSAPILAGTKSSVYGHWDVSGVETWWYTCHAKVIDDLSKVEEGGAAAFRAVLGLNPSISLLWEMLPWSWLIDWFSNFGDLLEASRGNIRFELDRLNLMAKFEADNICIVDSVPDGVSYNPGTYGFARKLREARTPYALPTLTFPLLTLRQVGILGSLAILRRSNIATR